MQLSKLIISSFNYFGSFRIPKFGTILYIEIFILISAFPVMAQTQKDVTRPNIIFIVSEDNSPFIGAYGDKFANTPNLDRFAERSILYENAYDTTPVCAPGRFTVITGTYANVLGTENMRSTYSIPAFIKFFPKYLKGAGYYTANNSKKDYNTVDQPEAWDESSPEATYKKRRPSQPFFYVKNIGITHESSLFGKADTIRHNSDKVPVPSYQPKTEVIKKQWARYYDLMEKMDSKVGSILERLKDEGLWKNTIVFYFSDHGGVLARSKKYLYESGLRIPLIIHVPEKYNRLAPLNPGSQSERLVSFIDFAPTVLSLAGIRPPEYMQGNAFLGKYKSEPTKYVYACRGRMGETRDLVRAVISKQYLYRRNYMPNRIYGQYNGYMWRAANVRSWEDAYKSGKLNEIQSRFWKPKPAEELYDLKQDSPNINNLAKKPKYERILKSMRMANKKFVRQNKDIGFLPESLIAQLNKKGPVYNIVREENIPMAKVIETAGMASNMDPSNMRSLLRRLNSKHMSVRFWAAQGFVMLGEKAMGFKDSLFKEANTDSSLAVQLVLSEILYNLGKSKPAIKIIAKGIENSQAMIRLQALNVLLHLNFRENEIPPSIISRIRRISQKKWSSSVNLDQRVAERLMETKFKD